MRRSATTAYESREDTEARYPTDGDQRDPTMDDPMASYTPEQREVVQKGMRILARVAVRAYMRRQASASSQPESATDDSKQGMTEEANRTEA